MAVIALVIGLLLQAASAPAPRPGVVTGQVQTADGTPVVAVRIAAIPAPPPEARPEEGTQYYTAQPPVSTAMTNGQGRYRLANIPPGRYYIVAGLIGQATYYPAT